jgi:type 1 glutamine amidotransferase
VRVALAAAALLVLLSVGAQRAPDYRVLLFSRTMGFRHDSIPDAVQAVSRLGPEHGFAVDATEDAAMFDDEHLAAYAAVMFLLTTGDVLDDGQQAAFERYIHNGGGFIGVHSATDTEYDWPWYGSLVGAYFADHPPGTYLAAVHLEGERDASTAELPDPWLRNDEWYNFRSNPRASPDVVVLAALDESTYPGGTMGDHPVAWRHAFDGGRAWYTAGGHTRESYYDPLFLSHLVGGIQYAAGLVSS